MLKFKCSDVGFSCGFAAAAATEMWDKIGAHALQGHNLKPGDITPPEMKGKIASKIQKA